MPSSAGRPVASRAARPRPGRTTGRVPGSRPEPSTLDGVAQGCVDRPEVPDRVSPARLVREFAGGLAISCPTPRVAQHRDDPGEVQDREQQQRLRARHPAVPPHDHQEHRQPEQPDIGSVAGAERQREGRQVGMQGVGRESSTRSDPQEDRTDQHDCRIVRRHRTIRPEHGSRAQGQASRRRRAGWYDRAEEPPARRQSQSAAHHVEDNEPPVRVAQNQPDHLGRGQEQSMVLREVGLLDHEQVAGLVEVERGTSRDGQPRGGHEGQRDRQGQQEGLGGGFAHGVVGDRGRHHRRSVLPWTSECVAGCKGERESSRPRREPQDQRPQPAASCMSRNWR